MLQDPFIDRADGFGQVLARLLAERFPLLARLGALCSQLMFNLLLFVLHRLRILCAIFNGGSASAAISFIKKRGCSHIRLVNLIAAPEGIKRMQEDHPDVDIYVAGMDDHLNEHGYIVPGLGDAGDRLFGTK